MFKSIFFSVLFAIFSISCAFQVPRASYIPATAEGNQCMNECMTIAFTGGGCGERCDAVLDACYRRCQKFHGGTYEPLAAQRARIEKDRGSSFIRQDRFKDEPAR